MIISFQRETCDTSMTRLWLTKALPYCPVHQALSSRGRRNSRRSPLLISPPPMRTPERRGLSITGPPSRRPPPPSPSPPPPPSPPCSAHLLAMTWCPVPSPWWARKNNLLVEKIYFNNLILLDFCQETYSMSYACQLSISINI